MTDTPQPPDRTRLLGAGTIPPGESVRVALETPLPDGVLPVLTSVRRGAAILRIVETATTPTSITITNLGTEDGSFMLFAASPKTRRAISFAGEVVKLFRHDALGDLKALVARMKRTTTKPPENKP